MGALALGCHVPKLTYYRYVAHLEQFFQSESVQDEWLIFAVEDGSFYFEIADRQAVASFGDLVFCPPGVVFRRVVISPVTLFVLRMNWCSDEGSELDLFRLSALPVGKTSLRHTDRLAASYDALKQSSAMSERCGAVSRNHHLHHLWLLYCEEHERWEKAEEEQPADPLIQQAVRRIELQAYERFSLNAVATELGISRAQLCKRFQGEMGVAPSKYLTALRLDKAKQLLAETNMTLDQISECCGYQNGFYLSRVFKNNCLQTPMQYRKEHRL